MTLCASADFLNSANADTGAEGFVGSYLDEWTEKDFLTAQKEKQVFVVEFGATWCAACKKTEPMVAEVSKDYPKIKFAKIDVAKNPGLASRMGVMSLPNILFINGGNIKEQIIATTNRKEIEEKLKKIAK